MTQELKLQVPPSTNVNETRTVSTSDGDGNFESTTTIHEQRIEGEVDEFHDTSLQDEQWTETNENSALETSTAEVIAAETLAEEIVQTEILTQTQTAALTADTVLINQLAEINRKLELLVNPPPLSSESLAIEEALTEAEEERAEEKEITIQTKPVESQKPEEREQEHPAKRPRKRSVMSLIKKK